VILSAQDRTHRTPPASHRDGHGIAGGSGELGPSASRRLLTRHWVGWVALVQGGERIGLGVTAGRQVGMPHVQINRVVFGHVGKLNFCARPAFRSVCVERFSFPQKENTLQTSKFTYLLTLQTSDARSDPARSYLPIITDHILHANFPSTSCFLI
jgi:hypothetical protein